MTEIEKTNIKELVNIIGNAELSNKCHSDCFINTDFDNECSLCRSATALFKAGYRKQEDTVKEFAEKVKFMLSDSKNNAIAGATKYGKDTLVGMNYAGEAFGIDKVFFALDFVSKQISAQFADKED